uniref:Spindle and centriole-associated protein 1 n=1 Tax=Varanus komodoensis TaxID=61221 RepID=A0A8D2IUN3_VARKO
MYFTFVNRCNLGFDNVGITRITILSVLCIVEYCTFAFVVVCKFSILDVRRHNNKFHSDVLLCLHYLHLFLGSSLSLKSLPTIQVRRHEMHKSKNKALVHLELQEKALKSKRKKQRPRVPESLEKKKLALMREILSEQYQLQDVLERSDQAMAMVKDLFGDTPHRHLGFPNVTVAPDYDMQSSLGPIVQKSDPPTQLSILSESVMDRQVIIFHMNSLNATNVVRKVHSRVQNEEQIPYTTFVVQQVLNANVRKEKQTVTKVKKKQSPQMPAGQKKKNLSTAATSFDLPNGNRTSLEVLNQMMHEMEEYEKWMGHEIQQVHDNQGVSGFTHSLVNALCRVMHYLKENERRMHQEMVDRQQLEKELGEHRALIDALTAEVLLLREENHAMQSKLQQCLVVRDEKLVSLSHALQGLSVTDISRRNEPILDYNGPKTNWLDALPVDLPNKAAVLNPPKKIHPTPTLSTHIFQPAVLLSPPQQKSSEALPLLQDDSTRRETDGEQISTPSHKPLMVQEDGSLLTQKVCVPVAIQTMHNSFRSHGQILENISAAPRPGFDDATEGIDPGVSMMCTQNEDLQEQINELTHQNSVIKTQLRAFGHCHEQGNGQTASSLKESKSLDERIAELNRQSAEARGKLLLLTNQQAVATFISVSPPVSPVFSPPRNLPENGRKTVEVSVPVVETLDGLKEDTFPPASGTSVRR